MVMSQNVGVWEWTDQRCKAAVLVAQDELTNIEIAAAVGVTDRQLLRWKKVPEFATRVKELAEEFGSALQRYAIARKQRRVGWLDRRQRRMEQVIEERAADPIMQFVPGGKTGLLVRDVKQIGSGENAQIVELYSVDTGLLKELRECEKQAAQELGQ